MNTKRAIDGRFEILSWVARGGMGDLYKALDRLTGAPVAVKVVARTELAHRFLRESAFLAEISHPAIVKYIAHGQTESGEPFLAMEWLEGVDLAKFLIHQRLQTPSGQRPPTSPALASESFNAATALARDSPHGTSESAATDLSAQTADLEAGATQVSKPNKSRAGTLQFDVTSPLLPADPSPGTTAGGFSPPSVRPPQSATSSSCGLTVPETLILARRIAAALAELHHRNIIHRDIKPSNIPSVEKRCSSFPRPSTTLGKLLTNPTLCRLVTAGNQCLRLLAPAHLAGAGQATTSCGFLPNTAATWTAISGMWRRLLIFCASRNKRSL